MRAAWKGKTDIVVELMKEGADIHVQDIVCCLLLYIMMSMSDVYI